LRKPSRPTVVTSRLQESTIAITGHAKCRHERQCWRVVCDAIVCAATSGAVASDSGASNGSRSATRSRQRAVSLRMRLLITPPAQAYDRAEEWDDRADRQQAGEDGNNEEER